MLKRFAEWILRDDDRAAPRKIGPRDSVTVVYTGDRVPEPMRESFEANVAKWRRGETVLFVPSSFKLVKTRRGLTTALRDRLAASRTARQEAWRSRRARLSALLDRLRKR